MNAMRSLLLVALVAALTGTALAQMTGTAPAPAMVLVKGNASILAAPNGMTLYVYDRDATGKSNCNGPCAGNWPPLLVTGNARPFGLYTIITRDDGTRQWAYAGRPLYFWKNDKAPLDTTGDHFANNLWHVATP